MTRRMSLLTAFVLLLATAVSISPALAIDEPDRLWLVGERAFADRLYPLAHRTLERFVERYPRDRRAGQALLLLGRTRFALGNLPLALEAFQRARAVTPPPGQGREVRFWEGETLFRVKRYAEARAAYDDVIRYDANAPFAPDAFYGYAWAELQLGRPEPAASALRELLQAWPDHALAAPATYHLARVLIDLKRAPEATPLLADFATRYPASNLVPDARFLLAMAQLGNGEPGAGVAEFRAFIAAHPEDARVPQARVFLTRQLAHAGDPTALREVYTELMAKTPQTAEGLAEAVGIATRLGRPLDREPALKTLVAQFPAHPFGQRAAFDAARMAFDREEWREAATWAETARRSEDNALRAEAALLAGESELKLKRYPAAVKAFEAVAAVPGVENGVRYRALAGLGLAREEQQDFRAALAAYEEVAADSPDAALSDWAKQRASFVRARLPKPAAPKPSPSSVKPPASPAKPPGSPAKPPAAAKPKARS